MPRSRVAVVSATPETIAEDYARLFRLAPDGRPDGHEDPPAVLVDLPWERFQPAVGVPPWQLEAVLSVLEGHGGPRGPLEVTARADSASGLRRALTRHRLAPLLSRRSVTPGVLPGETRVHESATRRPVLEAWQEGRIEVPRATFGHPLWILSTLKSHTTLGVAAAVFAAAQEILDGEDWRDHPRYAAAAAEALAVSREIHPSHFAVVDATVCGRGPGPYRVRPHVQNLLLASDDPVALDAVGARLLGLDPSTLPLLVECDRLGLGTLDPSAIEIVGEHPSLLDRSRAAVAGARFKPSWTVARWTPLRRKIRRAARDLLWYPFAGRRWRSLWRKTPWGRLFHEYEARGGRG